MRPRVVLVTRKTPLEVLLERRGTHDQARFHLRSRGQDIADYEAAHTQFEAAFAQVVQQIAADQRRVRVNRDDLDRFLFAPDDVVVVVGQDGLVPNVAKYLSGQLVIGVNSNPDRFDGVLCPHRPEEAGALLEWVEERTDLYRVQERVMGLVEREDGQRMLALNEFYLGHRSHQSSKYVLRVGGKEERQSSSGVLCSTGTGATGWARSVTEQRGIEEVLPSPEQAALAWFVREPFPSVWTGTDLDFGILQEGEPLTIDSLMGDDGVIFADGIESDRVEFLDGHRATISVAPTRLNLIVRSAVPD
ncbi:MAG: NAD(+)/NADH kinase [Deltaproteobacteria bacterium]|nr:NAD(+)/NADH kinase [Deltaproteobacteria bacterium]MBW2256108.1 NAD(+)/NADH kinase [Deltaproteobacteria bacterium]